MGNHFIAILFLLSFIICPDLLSGQQKYESESRMRSEEVPTEAILFLDAFQNKRKVRWYLEEGLDRKSIEAKFKLDRQKYSIEFDALGQFEDVEIEIRKKEIPESTLEKIKSQLSLDCGKFKIQKVQTQYTGDKSAVHSTITKASRSDAVTIKYELVVKCKSGNNSSLLEYLFTESGEKLAVSEIVFKNSSHLEY